MYFNSEKFIRLAVFLIFTPVFFHMSHPVVADPLWYDADRQALAINPYYDGFGGTIEVDFNDDHSSAGVITQNLWHYFYGYTTQLGLYKFTVVQFPDGGVSRSWVYGWGDRLGTLNSRVNFFTDVTTLYNGVESVDQFHYFVDEWNVPAGLTNIYVQPIVNGEPVPVLEDDVNDIYFRNCFPGVCNDVAWQGLDDVTDPVIISTHIDVNPKTINLRSNGNWITVYVEPPAGYIAEDIDPSSVKLAIGSKKMGLTGLQEATFETVGSIDIVDENHNGLYDLMVKFDRQALNNELKPGEVEIIVTGSLYSGEQIRGSEVIRVLDVK